jgi:hypothetical protein
MCRVCQQPRKASDSGYPLNAKAENVAISRRTGDAKFEENCIATTPPLLPLPEKESSMPDQAISLLSQKPLILIWKTYPLHQSTLKY